MRVATAILLAMASGSSVAGQRAALRLPRIFGDGMVLQRDARIPVWGWAEPLARVHVTLGEERGVAIAGRDGAWRTNLPQHAAGGPFTLTVESGDARIVLNDVLIGDVWVASGQSNMEWKVSASNDAAREIASARDTKIRHFKVPNSWSWTPEADLTGGSWSAADAQHVGDFSAVGYFFARELRKNVDVPIGILNTSWSGSAIAPWLSREALGLDDAAWAAVMQAENQYQSSMRATLTARLGALPTTDSGLVNGRALWADPELDDGAWSTINAPGAWERAGYAGLDGIAWYRTSFTLTAEEAARGLRLGAGVVDDGDITYVNGVEVGRMSSYGIPRVYDVPATALRAGRNILTLRVTDGGGDGGILGSAEQLYIDVGGARRSLAGSWKFKVAQVSLSEDGQHINKIPAILYNRMVHPLLAFPIKGVLWYQGESNANNDAQATAYRAEFATLIKSWRREWGGRRDVPFLWVQLANYGAVDTVPPARASWAVLRESQSAALALPKTGQAVIIDIGDAGDIHPRNKQDVGRRLALLAESIVYGRKVESSGPVYRRHSVRDGRVTIEFDHADELVSRTGENVQGFAIAGADGRFVWANARIEGNRVVVWSDEVKQPAAVRYAWGNSPRAPGLYNGAGLPAAPFRTDR